MKKNKITIVLFILLFIITATTQVFAATISTSDINRGQTPSGALNKIKSMSNTIFTAIYNIGVVISVVIMAVVGIKYMLGSANQRAEYKKTMIPYLVGACLLFGASTLTNVIYRIARRF